MPSVDRTPQQTYRPALLPGLIAAAALLAGIPLMGADWFLAIRFVVAILALIVAWFAVQAGQWWWALAFTIVAVAWNPVVPVPIEGAWWVLAHIAVAALFPAAGALIRLPRPAG